MGKEEFLRLLVAQLQNQDPLSPMESQQFASELAQFSSLEQLVNIDGKLEESIGTNVVLTQAINNTLAANLLGNEATLLGNSLQVGRSGDVDVHFRLQGMADDVEVRILDEAGNVVRTLTAKAMAGGNQSLSWDGEDARGKRVPAGTYHFEVSATDGGGNPVGLIPLMVGTISSVRYESGSAVLVVNGQDMPFSQVLSIGAPAGGGGGR